jgi:hypothetical protein
MPNVITIQTKNLDKMKGRITKAQKRVIKDTEKVLEAYGQVGVQALQQASPRKTGTFASGFGYQIGGRGTKDMELRITWSSRGKTPPKLLDWIVFGTGVYGPRKSPIVPKRAKRLSWVSDSGRRIFAKQVRGMKPRNFIKDAWQSTSNYRRSMAQKIGALIVGAIRGERGGGSAL